MTWTNPIDRMPQIPQDWANHIAQGGLWVVAAVAIALAAGLLFSFDVTTESVRFAVFFFSAVMAAVSVLKKVVDYFKENETWQMCVGKALVTILWPASLCALCLLIPVASK